MKICAAVALVALLPVAAWSQAKKPQTAPQRVVLGTKQLAGDFGKIGVTYTIGKQAPLNLTLQKVEYSIDRLTKYEVSGLSEPYFHGGAYTVNVLPKSDSQLMILHGAIQNPNSKETPLSIESFTWTAVTKDDRNFGVCGLFSVEGTRKYLSTSLKPGQKVMFVVALIVPAGGEIPKLIVARQGEAQPVIRYNLQGVGNGATLNSKEVQPGVRDTYIPTEYLDWKISGPITYRDGALGDYMPDDGKRWAIVSVTFRGLWNRPSGGEATVRMHSLDATLQTEDGENLMPYVFARPGGFEDQWLYAKKDEIYSGSPDEGQEVTARMAFLVGKDAKPTMLVVKQNEYRTYKFPADQLTAK